MLAPVGSWLLKALETQWPRRWPQCPWAPTPGPERSGAQGEVHGQTALSHPGQDPILEPRNSLGKSASALPSKST